MARAPLMQVLEKGAKAEAKKPEAFYDPRLGREGTQANKAVEMLRNGMLRKDIADELDISNEQLAVVLSKVRKEAPDLNIERMKTWGETTTVKDHIQAMLEKNPSLTSQQVAERLRSMGYENSNARSVDVIKVRLRKEGMSLPSKVRDLTPIRELLLKPENRAGKTYAELEAQLPPGFTRTDLYTVKQLLAKAGQDIQIKPDTSRTGHAWLAPRVGVGRPADPNSLRGTLRAGTEMSDAELAAKFDTNIKTVQVTRSQLKKAGLLGGAAAGVFAANELAGDGEAEAAQPKLPRVAFKTEDGKRVSYNFSAGDKDYRVAMAQDGPTAPMDVYFRENGAPGLSPSERGSVAQTREVMANVIAAMKQEASRLDAPLTGFRFSGSTPSRDKLYSSILAKEKMPWGWKAGQETLPAESAFYVKPDWMQRATPLAAGSAAGAVLAPGEAQGAKPPKVANSNTKGLASLFSAKPPPPDPYFSPVTKPFADFVQAEKSPAREWPLFPKFDTANDKAVPLAIGTGAALALGANTEQAEGATLKPSLMQKLAKVANNVLPEPQPNTLFTFGGVNAKTADKGKLAEAQKMAEAGKSREEIWNKTGWFKGVDDKWRFEIDDSGAKLTPKAERTFSHLRDPAWDDAQAPLTDTLRHDAYFRAYPKLKSGEVTLHRGPNETGALYDDGDIRASAPDEAGVRGVLLHEGQHKVQNAEGFERGGSVSAPNYNRLAGEVEARNVETRKDFTQEQRKAQPPWTTEDVPADQQIRFDAVDAIKRAIESIAGLGALTATGAFAHNAIAPSDANAATLKTLKSPKFDQPAAKGAIIVPKAKDVGPPSKLESLSRTGDAPFFQTTGRPRLVDAAMAGRQRPQVQSDPALLLSALAGGSASATLPATLAVMRLADMAAPSDPAQITYNDPGPSEASRMEALHRQRMEELQRRLRELQTNRPEETAEQTTLGRFLSGELGKKETKPVVDMATVAIPRQRELGEKAASILSWLSQQANLGGSPLVGQILQAASLASPVVTTAAPAMVAYLGNDPLQAVAPEDWLLGPAEDFLTAGQITGAIPGTPSSIDLAREVARDPVRAIQATGKLIAPMATGETPMKIVDWLRNRQQKNAQTVSP